MQPVNQSAIIPSFHHSLCQSRHNSYTTSLCGRVAGGRAIHCCSAALLQADRRCRLVVMTWSDANPLQRLLQVWRLIRSQTTLSDAAPEILNSETTHKIKLRGSNLSCVTK